MSYETILSDRAKKEIDEAWQWYDDKLPGLGDRFVQSIFENLVQIEINPECGMQRRRPFRETIVKVFPYLIIYKIEKKRNEIFVHSVFHMSRNPRKKYSSK